MSKHYSHECRNAKPRTQGKHNQSSEILFVYSDAVELVCGQNRQTNSEHQSGAKKIVKEYSFHIQNSIL